jgi:citrate synthase
MAQWMEWMDDEERRIVRPRQIYTGPRDADYVPINER